MSANAVCRSAGIQTSPIPQFDGTEFLELAARWAIRTEVQQFALEQANEALRLHRSGELQSTAVLVP